MRFEVLVPTDRKVALVLADGGVAELMTTHKQEGMPYEVRTYNSWDSNNPPHEILIRYE